MDTASISDAISIYADYYTEAEFNFQFTDNATEGAAYCFRLTNNGALLDTYAEVAEIDARTDVDSEVRIKGGTHIKGGIRINLEDIQRY